MTCHFCALFSPSWVSGVYNNRAHQQTMAEPQMLTQWNPCRPLAGWWGGDTPGGHSQSGLGHMLRPHLAGSLLHLPTLPQPASYHNPPPNLDSWRPVSASGGAESCPLRTQLMLTLGTQVAKIPSLLEHPTQPAWAASPGCWILRCPFVQSTFLRTSERDHYTPSSFLQQR